MIPTMIVFGLLFGRWWRLSGAAAVIVWPLILVMTGVLGIAPRLAGAAAFGLVNAAAGVAAHQAVLRLVRLLRRPRVRA